MTSFCLVDVIIALLAPHLQIRGRLEQHAELASLISGLSTKIGIALTVENLSVQQRDAHIFLGWLAPFFLAVLIGCSGWLGISWPA